MKASERFAEALTKFTEYKLAQKKRLLDGEITLEEYNKLIKDKARELDL